MKHSLIILVTLFSLLSIHAQTKAKEPRKILPDMDTLDYTSIRCLYKQQVTPDTLKPQKKLEDIMILQIGKNISKYFDFLSFQADSLMYADYCENPEIDFLEGGILNSRYKSGNETRLLFKNFPINKFTTINYIYIDKYLFEESIVLPQWQIEKETKTILGYPCIKATCRYYGRNYEAWFTVELPILNGPWKLTGLPGLILEAHDDKKQYSFECTQIQQVTWAEPITISRSSAIMKTNKTMYYKMLKAFYDNPQGTIGNQTKIQASEQARSIKKLPYNPIELSEEP